MNRTELQNDFYKRCGVSKSRLVFSRAGLLCTLLGHNEIHGSEFLACTLSMCVNTAGRMLSCSALQLENTQSDICSVIRVNDTASQSNRLYDIAARFRERPFGAELLTDSSIPAFFRDDTALRASVLNTLLKIDGCDKTNEQKALICADGGNPAPYTALFNSRRDYCCSVNGSKCALFPLPLTGYKIITAQTRASKRTRRTATVGNAYKKLRRIYPHILSLKDITCDMLELACGSLNSSELKYTRHILFEHERITLAKAALTACRLRDFAKIVNDSQKSIEHLWGCNAEHTLLAAKASENPSCICARQWENGIFAIAEDGSEDSLINILRHDFNARFGYFPRFCIADTCGTE